MKKSLLFFAILAIASVATAQIKITTGGNVGIGTNNPGAKLHVDFGGGDWERAIRTTVHYKSTCSYNLWNTYYGKDVFFVCGEGYLWTMKGGYFGSDSTLKRNITSIEGALNKVKSLQGIRFQYKNGKEEEPDEDFRLGFIAQDVEAILPEVVKNMPDYTKAMSYTDLIAVVVEAIKEQQTLIESQQIMITTLQTIVSAQELDIETLKSSYKVVYEVLEPLQKCCGIKGGSVLPPPKEPQTLEDEAILYQNAPNPFTSNTEISYYLPETTTQAVLYIYNLQGIELQSYLLTETGSHNVTISGSALPAGIYLYTLIVNNEIIDTKRMILTK